MASKKKRPATMTDVAKLAGVSQTTVSFIVNDAPLGDRIPEETRQRVLTAIESLDYRPNAMAQALRTNQSRIIGFVTDLIATTPHAGRIVRGAQDAAWENNRMLLLVNTDGERGVETATIEVMLEHQVDAIIYATMYHRLASPPANIRQVSTVLLNCFVEDYSLPSVLPDDESGGYLATKTLLDKGHRRIGMINNSSPIPATFHRLQGYKRALEDYGIPFDDQLLCSGLILSSRTTYDCTRQLMGLPEPPTAIFCFNDQMAIGVYDALRDLNLSIPDEVAVIGFDNLEIISTLLHPPLSSIELPHYQMGQWAVNYLLGNLPEAKVDKSVQQRITCPYIERQSV